MKEEIKKRILSFKSDQEILEFIKNRIIELEQNLVPEKIGFGYKNIYNDYISSEIKYIVGHSFFKDDFPSLVFDDVTPYFELIKQLSKSKEYYNELYLFTPLMYEVFNYLSSTERRVNALDTARKRDKLYLNALRNQKSTISIKEFHDEKLGLCGENAGIAHNLFKILGIDSQLVIGKRNDEEHAFNIVFPRGYDSTPAVLFDPSHTINFKSEEQKNYSLGYFKVLTSEEYNKMISGGTISIDLEGSVNNLFRYYPMLSGCVASYEKANYSILLDQSLNLNNESHTKKE